MMTVMVERVSMLVAWLRELDHAILRTYLADMEGNYKNFKTRCCFLCRLILA